MINIFRRLAVLPLATLLLATAACSEISTAPAAAPAFGPRLAASANDTAITIIKVGPTKSTTYPISGGHKVQIAAYSVCNPAVSTYGPTEWDKPCVTIATTITVTVKSWINAAGRPQLHFSPDLRFAPGTVNTIWVSDKAASSNPLFRVSGTNEAVTDPRVTTNSDRVNGYLYRRVKYFSGYTVTAD
ncbi:hypothetical protein [Gemmatimonas sp.]|uniref:hypothetical protein n=1 Tax=Gemmatimonas sp. TaxID=1962908 RepID=UPI003983C755